MYAATRWLRFNENWDLTLIAKRLWRLLLICIGMWSIVCILTQTHHPRSDLSCFCRKLWDNGMLSCADNMNGNIHNHEETRSIHLTQKIMNIISTCSAYDVPHFDTITLIIRPQGFQTYRTVTYHVQQHTHTVELHTSKILNLTPHASSLLLSPFVDGANWFPYVMRSCLKMMTVLHSQDLTWICSPPQLMLQLPAASAQTLCAYALRVTLPFLQPKPRVLPPTCHAGQARLFQTQCAPAALMSQEMWILPQGCQRHKLDWLIFIMACTADHIASNVWASWGLLTFNCDCCKQICIV